MSGYELRLMLGIKSRLELDAFLKTHGVYLEYTEEDFAHDAKPVASSNVSKLNLNERYYLQHDPNQLSCPG
jgi:hypothetical protein